MAAGSAAALQHADAVVPGAGCRAGELTVAALAFETPAMSRRSHSAIGRFGAEAPGAVAIDAAARESERNAILVALQQWRGTHALLQAGVVLQLQSHGSMWPRHGMCGSPQRQGHWI